MDIESCYSFKPGTDGIPLLQNLPCSFSLRGKEINSQAAIVFDTDWSAEIRTEIEWNLEDSLLSLASMPNTNQITINGREIPVFITGITPSTTGKSIITFTPSQEPFPIMGTDETQISMIIFHLFDFKDRFGTTHKIIRSENSAYSLGITELESEKWKVELHEIKKPDEENRKRKRDPVMTHVCCLTRIDSAEFGGNSARQMLLNLKEFFTFSQGSFCSPVMPVGFDKTEKKVWALGTSPHYPIKNSMSWFDPHHSNQLAKLFPNFLSKLDDERWRNTLHSVIYWYVRSNNTSGSGIDSGIILSQVAIEKLAYEYAVNQRKLIEPNGFKDLKASDKYRLLFASLDIPTSIPPNLVRIQKIAKKFKYIDSPHFLTEIRNAIVHPEHKRHDDFSGLYYDAWRLGMWYLELAILRLCDYKDTYANRLPDEHWVGQVEEVPWGQTLLPGCSGE